MPTVFLSPGPFGAGGQFFDANGRPLNAGRIATFAAGTSTPTATYTTKAGTVQNANPITLNSDGRAPQEIWLIAATGYKFEVVDSVSNLLGTYDDLYGINDPATNNAIGYTGATISGALTMNLAPINEAQGANIPVASAINLTTATGNYLSLTGSGTVTAIQLSQGAYRELVVNTVSAAFVNSATMALLGGTSFTPSVGDILGFRGEAAPVVRQVLYQKASGAPLAPAGSTVSNTMAAAVVLTNSTAYTDCISVSVGSAGLWYASGNVTMHDTTAGTVVFGVRLSDGVTIGDQCVLNQSLTSAALTGSLSAFFNNPSGPIKLSVRDVGTNSGVVLMSLGGVSCAGVISAFRIG